MSIEILETPASAGTILRLTPCGVRWQAKKGHLPVAAMTSSGQYLFRRTDVEALARSRREAHRSARKAPR